MKNDNESDLGKEVQRLRRELAQFRREQTIFQKAYRVAGLWGDFVEFGVFTGDSMIQAYRCCKAQVAEMVSGEWDHSFEDDGRRNLFTDAWDKMRFIGFDSFVGMPPAEGIDAKYPVFEEGSYACSKADFEKNLEKAGVDLGKVVSVEGFFEQTLTAETAESLLLSHVAIAHFDCDTYQSTRAALDFITPYLNDYGAVLVFDDWFQFFGNPLLGQQQAFREWQQSHPDWAVTEFQKEGATRNSFIVAHRNPKPRPSQKEQSRS
jgi:hypothetical protein